MALKPGQMLLYESAKCPHGRSSALKGDWYASLFSHFMPVDRNKWPYTQHDIWLAVPGDWDKPPITQSGVSQSVSQLACESISPSVRQSVSQ